MELIVSKRAFQMVVMASLIAAILVAPLFGLVLRGVIKRYRTFRIQRPFIHSLLSNLLSTIAVLLFLSISPSIGSGVMVGGSIFIIFYGINFGYYFWQTRRDFHFLDRCFIANDLVILLMGIYVGIPIAIASTLTAYSFI